MLIRASLILALAPGFGLGLGALFALAFRLPLAVPWLSLAQVHGQAQALGFVGLFILGVATVLLPRFLASPIRQPRLCIVGGALLASGVTLRAIAQPWEALPLRPVWLGLSAALALIGLVVYARPMLEAQRKSIQPRGMWQVLLATAGLSLVAALVLNAVAMAELMVEGQVVVAAPLNEAMLHLELWGFVVSVVLAVSLRVLPRFLLLRPTFEPLLPPAYVAYAAGILIPPLGWLARLAAPAWGPLLAAVGWSALLVGLLGLVGLLRLFEPGTRPSGMPHVTYPTRAWIRAAYAWLLVAALLGVVLAIRPLVGGPAPSFTEWSAQRHALTMGFIVVMIVAMAARILPVYSAWALYRLRFLRLMIGMLLLGALLRVGGEWLGGYASWAAPVVALGGALGFLGFVLFAATLWPALGAPGTAGPGDVKRRPA